MGMRIAASLRQYVARRAGWRCEYCLLHEDDSFAPHQPDHVISRKHEGPTVAANLALACIRCNARKGSDMGTLGSDGVRLVRLFHPRLDHFHDSRGEPFDDAVRRAILPAGALSNAANAV